MTGKTRGSTLSCCSVVSGPRLIGKISSVETRPERVEVRFEDDTHADKCAVDKECYIEKYLYQYCIVKQFLDLFEGKKLPIVNTLYCYDYQDGQSYIICVKQAQYFKYEEVVLM